VDLAPGSRIGPYEVLAPIGAGGMGKVYRARDARLGREVAIKVLSAARLEDEAVVRRFELEARLAGSLNHPNILGLYDVGEHEGVPYLVSELLEGNSLRVVLAKGPLSLPRILSIALQTAQGLAAAHAKDIVHRDLKPDNLFVLHDGRVKILDFGIAKLIRADQTASTITADAPHTMTGAMVGTPAYMSPEQARGQPLDPRSDLFSFGSIVYEMITGQRAFQGHTAFETGYAILNSDPAPLGPEVPRAVQRMVFHCLEKRLELRFQSSRDLVYELEELVAVGENTPMPGDPRRSSSPRLSSMGGGPRWTPGIVPPVLPAAPLASNPRLPPIPPAVAQGPGQQPHPLPHGPTPANYTDPNGPPLQGHVTVDIRPPAAPRQSKLPLLAASAVALLSLAAVAFLLLRGRDAQTPKVEQLTFRRGYVATARFTPDGANLIFSAAWNNGPLELYTSRLGSPELRPLGMGPAELLSVSKRGALAVLLRANIRQLVYRSGTLAVVDAIGNMPRELAEKVLWADFGPDGESLAVVRDEGATTALEYPLGTLLYRSEGTIRFPRFSPQGDAISFIDSPARGSLRGPLVVLGLDGKKVVLQDGSRQAISTPIWSRDGGELYFVQAAPGTLGTVKAVKRSGGAARTVHADTGQLWLQSFGQDGRLLVTNAGVTSQLVVSDAGGQRDLSWFDSSVLRGLSHDGKWLLFGEDGAAAEREPSGFVAYSRPADGSPPTRLGQGWPQGFAPDGRTIVMADKQASPISTLSLVPVGAGAPRAIPLPPLRVTRAFFHPDGKRLLLSAQTPGKEMQAWSLAMDGGAAKAISAEGVWAGPISPRGDRFATFGPRNSLALYPIDGGEPTIVAGTEGKVGGVASWTDLDGIYFVTPLASPDLWRFDLRTSEMKVARHFAAPDAAGFLNLEGAMVSGDEKTIAWSYEACRGALFLLDGVR
jgi:serine/threonine protein kinase/dipeptidyl aminopeptidase/acylaminoacyl peptidase